MTAKLAIKIDETRIVGGGASRAEHQTEPVQQSAEPDAEQIADPPDLPFFAKIAGAAIDRGFSVIPLLPKSKAVCTHLAKNGAVSRTRNRDLIAFWAEQEPNANLGICSDDEITILESDDEIRFRQLIREVSGNLFGVSRELPATLTSQARAGRPHWYFKNTEKTREHKDSPGIAGLFEWRHTNQYVADLGSIHPLGMTYEIVVNSEIIPMPDWLVSVLEEIKAAYRGTNNAASNFVKVGPAGIAIEALKTGYNRDPKAMLDDPNFKLSVGGGERHYFFNSIAGLIHDGERTDDDIFEVLCAFRDEYCENPEEKSDEEIRRIADWVTKREPCARNPVHVGLEFFASEDDPAFLIAKGKEALAKEKQAGALEKEKPGADGQGGQEYGNLLTYGELQKRRQGAKPYLVECICRRGQIVLVAGDSALGKSALVNQLGWAVATGQPFLGRPTQQAKALIIDIENSADQQLELAECFRKMFGQAEFPETIAAPDNIWTDVAGQKQLEHFIAGFNPGIVVIDSLKSFQCEAEKAGKENGLFMQWARRITKTYDCTMVLVHHPRKPPADTKVDTPWLGDDQLPVITWMNGAAGAKGLINLADVRWGVDRAHHEKECFVMRINERTVGDSGVMRVIREYDDEGREAGYSLRHGLSLLTDAQIEKYISLPQEFHFTDACKACGGAKSVASRLINRAKQAGALRQVGRGRYEKIWTADREETEKCFDKNCPF